MKSKASVDIANRSVKNTRNKVEMVGFSKGSSTVELTKDICYPEVVEGYDDPEPSAVTEDSLEQGSKTSSRYRGFSMIFYKYGSRASLNGVPFIMQSRHILVKAAWSFLLAAAIGASIFHLYYLFSNYFEFQKYSQVNLKFDSLQFPAVTICNVNMMRLSQRQYASKEIQRLFQTAETLKQVINNDANVTPSESDADPDINDPSLLDWVTEKELALCQYCHYCWAQGQFENSSLYEVDDYFTYLYNKQALKTRETLGHQLNGMVRMCSFAGRMCGYDNFKRVVSPQYGNCYTLENKDFVSRKSGPTGGLELIISLETDEYIPAITPGVGARVIIHEPGTAPLHDNNDMAMSPREHTFIALRKVEINRIGAPYSPCVSETEKINGYKYTKTTCQKECEQNHIKQACNCYDSELDQWSSTNKNMTQSLAQCKKKEERLCLYKVRCALEANKNACDCKDLCRESNYEKTIATLQWPTDSYIDYIKPEICNTPRPPSICRQNESKGAFRDELVKLNIYYEDLNYEVLTDQPNYEIINLLSDIGGSIGLWIGLSVLSLFELVHLAVEVIRYFTCRKWKKRAEKMKSQKEETKESLPKE